MYGAPLPTGTSCQCMPVHSVSVRIGARALTAEIHVPATLTDGLPPLLALHGISRDARGIAREFTGPCARRGQILIVPRFSNRHWPHFQRIGGVRPDQALLSLLSIVQDMGLAATQRVALFGYSGGAQDGSATLEAAMDELIEARRAVAPTGFTLPAGNMFVDRTHAQVSLDAGATMDPLPWRLPPDDRTSTFMELWLPPGLSPSDLEITLHGPGATFGPPGPVAATLNGAAPGRLTVTDVTWNGGVVGQLSADEGRTGRWRILAALAPTEVSLPGHAPAGLWHIAIKDTRSTGTAQSLRFWIQRDLSYGRGNTGARQSYFDEPKNRLVDPSGRVEEADTPGAATQRYGSLNGMATGAATLVVGAAQGNPDASPGFKPELYTSASQPADPAQVDLSAMVSANAGETGRLGLTARSGPRARMTGTSASSPAVGAALAKIIEAQPAGPEPTNYLDALKAANAIKPSAPKHTPRLGAGIIKDD